MISLEAIKFHGLRKENNNSNNGGYHMKWQTFQLLEGRVLSTGHCGEESPHRWLGGGPWQLPLWSSTPTSETCGREQEACLGWHCTPNSNLGC